MSHRSCTPPSAPIISHLFLQLLLATTLITAATIPHHTNPSSTTTTNTTDPGPIIFKIPDSQLTLEYHTSGHPHAYLDAIQLRTCALRNQLWIEDGHPADPRYPHAAQRLAPFNAPERVCHMPHIYLGVGYARQSDLLSWVDLMNVFRGLHMAAWEPWFYNFAGVVSVQRETSGSGSYEVSEVGMYFSRPVGEGNGTVGEEEEAAAAARPPAGVVTEAVAAAGRDESGVGRLGVGGGRMLNLTADERGAQGGSSSVSTVA